MGDNALLRVYLESWFQHYSHPFLWKPGQRGDDRVSAPRNSLGQAVVYWSKVARGDRADECDRHREAATNRNVRWIRTLAWPRCSYRVALVNDQELNSIWERYPNYAGHLEVDANTANELTTAAFTWMPTSLRSVTIVEWNQLTDEVFETYVESCGFEPLQLLPDYNHHHFLSRLSASSKPSRIKVAGMHHRNRFCTSTLIQPNGVRGGRMQSKYLHCWCG
eukprot:gb/GECG01015235.1/.p1 GENE.gb/GECG01015235.1/~~gb/GECG01015235.1/.p1  ORF type:complete len:221 (+),score=9.25 gb/GECG01015235.1/:1-663(+)